MKKISVIMPVYNCEKTVEKAIKSVLNQTFNNYELIIVDDGSTDNSYEICKALECGKIKIIHQCNKGPSYARNIGIELANGKYIMFIDSDDSYKKDTLRIMYNSIEKYKVDLVTAGYEYSSIKNINFNKNKFFIRKDKYIDCLQNKNLLNPNWNKIYKSDIIKKNNIKFDTNKEIGEDVRFNFKYIKCSNTFLTCSNIIYEYNFNNYGLTNKNKKDKVERIYNFLVFQNKYYEDLKLNTRKFQKKIIKDFLYIYNKDEKTDKNLEKFILNIPRKILLMHVLSLLCKTKKKIIIKAIIKIFKRIRD